MTHAEVLTLKNGDRVIAIRAGGVYGHPQYDIDDTGRVTRFEFGCPGVVRDDGTDLGYVHFRNWSTVSPRPPEDAGQTTRNDYYRVKGSSTY